ncbi:MAG: hydroxymethylbilane synthase [Oscillospiraceae bacterium]
MKIRIGTRKSRLALAQTEMVRVRILKAYPDAELEIIPVSTKGDRVTDRPLEKVGGSGVFVKEIEQLLLNGEIDIAVHSAKDLPVQLAEGLVVSGVLKRGNPRDMLILRGDLPITPDAEWNIGTGSLRRRQNMQKLFPKVRFSDIRGNVDTRLKKLSSGEYDGIILACAGIERINADIGGFKCVEFALDEFLPAACQAIIAIECRSGSEAAKCVRSISDSAAMIQYLTEKELLKTLCADCTTPVSAYSYLDVSGEVIHLSASLEPNSVISGSAPVSEHIALARRIAKGLQK